MNIRHNFYIILFFSIAFFTKLNSQCFENGHNSNLENLWLSCSESTSPNPSRDRGHWILYEFDEEKRITGFHFWNVNHPDYLSSGSKSIAIDYRDNNGEWKNHDSFTLVQGDGSGYYEGESYQMLEHVTSDKILIFVLDNHGGQCAGLAEVKINVLSATTSTEDIAEDHFDIVISPNPVAEFATVSIDGLEQNEINYKLIDNTGKVIRENLTKTLNGKTHFEIDTQNLPSGNYYLKVSDGLKVSSRKLVLQSQ